MSGRAERKDRVTDPLKAFCSVRNLEAEFRLNIGLQIKSRLCVTGRGMPALDESLCMLLDCACGSAALGIRVLSTKVGQGLIVTISSCSASHMRIITLKLDRSSL